MVATEKGGVERVVNAVCTCRRANCYVSVPVHKAKHSSNF